MEQILSIIFADVVNGNNTEIVSHIKTAFEDNFTADAILNDSLIAAMAEVGRRFEIGEYFVPEMLIAARAMKSGLAVLKPLLVKGNIEPTAKVVLGTVKGDLHDIGKNLVGLMLEGAGFEIIDAGSDVAPERFVDLVRKHEPEILGMSALLTTTMSSMQTTIAALEEHKLRNKVKIMIGGAPITEGYAAQADLC
jgi:5-methyltetrahydrofolate--homocysteine methyltransferase